MRKHGILIKDKNDEIIIEKNKEYIKDIKIILFILILYCVFSIYIISQFKEYLLEFKIATIEVLYPFTFLLFLILNKKSKEIIVFANEYIILKRYFLFFCYYKKKISNSSVKDIYYEKFQVESAYIIVFINLVRNFKIRVINKNFKEKIYAYGVDLNEEEFRQIIELVSERLNKVQQELV